MIDKENIRNFSNYTYTFSIYYTNASSSYTFLSYFSDIQIKANSVSGPAKLKDVNWISDESTTHDSSLVCTTFSRKNLGDPDYDYYYIYVDFIFNVGSDKFNSVINEFSDNFLTIKATLEVS